MTNLPHTPARAPRPVQRLGERLASAGTPLVPVPVNDPRPGDQFFHAVTHAGTVRVWCRERVWAVTLAPPGTDVFVDSGVWEACQTGGALSYGLASIDRQVSWIEGLLDQPSAPSYDAACLRARAAERTAQAENGPGAARTILYLAVAGAVILAMAWGAVAFDAPILRVMAALTAVSVMVGFVVPSVQRAVRRRRQDR